MFEALNGASSKNKYQIPWVDLSPVQFQGEIPGWFTQLKKSRIHGGTSKSQRQALAKEFYTVMHQYRALLDDNSVNSPTAKMHVQRSDVNVRWFRDRYKLTFGEMLTANSKTEFQTNQLIEKRKVINDKLAILMLKKELVGYWKKGLTNFPDHITPKAGDDQQFVMMMNYLGNAPRAQVKFYLGMIINDADKIAKLNRIGPAFTHSIEKRAGVSTAGDNGKLTKVTWTDELFKKAVKAEIGAALDVGIKGKCELEFKGIKATLEGEALAGMKAGAQGEASLSAADGLMLKGSVEVEIGVKITTKATVEMSDFLTAEASAEAFAGAMAKAEVEFWAAVGSTKLKISAEAFAGARVSATGKFGMKIQGYSIFEGEAKATAMAGAGAEFKLEFEASAFGGAKFGVEANAAAGLGGGAGATVAVHGDNFGRAMHSLYYTSYLTVLNQSKTKYLYVEYFRTLEDNEILFKKADKLLDELMTPLLMERNSMFSRQMQLEQVLLLAEHRIAA